jgi:hypothetical protein
MGWKPRQEVKASTTPSAAATVLQRSASRLGFVESMAANLLTSENLGSQKWVALPFAVNRPRWNFREPGLKTAGSRPGCLGVLIESRGGQTRKPKGEWQTPATPPVWESKSPESISLPVHTLQSVHLEFGHF